MSLLSTTGLTKDYDGLRAVDGVDLAVDAGTIHALIGPNGAGKSTLVGMISGRIIASAGTVVFDGADVTGWSADRRIRAGMAYTFQITSIYPKLSLFDNLALALRHRDPDAVHEALQVVGLADRQSQRAGDLSYGHQRLLEIAMGVAQSPRLLILDEPTQGLAESEIAAFNALIKRLAGEVTILLIEHNMNVVMALAERITVLDAGAVLASGAPDEIRGNAAVQAAYLGSDHAEA